MLNQKNYIILLVTFLCGAVVGMGTMKTIHGTAQKNETWVTVWVHGTTFLMPDVIERFKDKPLANLIYNKQGMNHGSEYESWAHKSVIHQALSEFESATFDKDHIYFFGWNGQLSFVERTQAAQNLYQSLQDLCEDLQKKGHTNIKLRLITHSHGGNVALQLSEQATDKDFSIDELILLACPVQKETADLVKDSIFKKVFSIFSTWDMLQVADPQGLYPVVDTFINQRTLNGFSFEQGVFSGRVFPKADNLKQAEITLNGRGILHLEFLYPKFLARLPQILDHMNSHPDATVAQVAL